MPPPPLLPIAIGPYRPVALLGEGGMANAYRVLRTFEGGHTKEFALKSIKPQLALDERHQIWFTHEVAVQAKLSHRSIVQLVDAGIADQMFVGMPPVPVSYLVLEYVRGCSLDALLQYFEVRRLKVPLRIAVLVLHEIASALHYLATRTEDGEVSPIVHRDVTPSNVMLALDGSVKLLDMGIAYREVESDGRTEVGQIKGKPGYLAPEQLLDFNGTDVSRTITPALDVFALGITAYRLLSGERLFPKKVWSDKATYYRVLLKGDFPKEHPSIISDEELRVVLRGMLATQPADRPSAEHVRRVLARLLMPGPEGSASAVSMEDREELSRLIHDIAVEPSTEVSHQAVADEFELASVGEASPKASPVSAEPFVDEYEMASAGMIATPHVTSSKRRWSAAIAAIGVATVCAASLAIWQPGKAPASVDEPMAQPAGPSARGEQPSAVGPAPNRESLAPASPSAVPALEPVLLVPDSSSREDSDSQPSSREDSDSQPARVVAADNKKRPHREPTGDLTRSCELQIQDLVDWDSSKIRVDGSPAHPVSGKRGRAAQRVSFGRHQIAVERENGGVDQRWIDVDARCEPVIFNRTF